MNPDAFLDLILPGALASQKTYGIPASFTLAQAALESGWGGRAPGNNLFGIKADAGWHGPTVSIPTHEVLNGRWIALTALFRAYASLADSIMDHAQFLKDNKRYAPAFAQTTGEGWAQAMQDCHYATDPDYAKKLISTMHARHLTRFDQPQGEKK